MAGVVVDKQYFLCKLQHLLHNKGLVCTQLDKARRAYHKVSRKEQAAREREAHAQGNPDVAIDKQKKIQEERELAQQEAEKVSNTCFISLASLVSLSH